MIELVLAAIDGFDVGSGMSHQPHGAQLEEHRLPGATAVVDRGALGVVALWDIATVGREFGQTLKRAQAALDNVKAKGDEATGVDIIRRAIEQPLSQIAINAGLSGEVTVERVKAAKGNIGLDANNPDKLIDLVEAGIIDPAKVTRMAIENAASIAALLLTTEAIITDIPEEEKTPAGAGMGGGMGGMGMGGY